MTSCKLWGIFSVHRSSSSTVFSPTEIRQQYVQCISGPIVWLGPRWFFHFAMLNTFLTDQSPCWLQRSSFLLNFSFLTDQSPCWLRWSSFLLNCFSEWLPSFSAILNSPLYIFHSNSLQMVLTRHICLYEEESCNGLFGEFSFS